MLVHLRHAGDAPSPKPVQCFGPEAAAYTASRFFGQVVQLEDDVERHDIYGRRPAYVYLDGATIRARALAEGLYARASW